MQVNDSSFKHRGFLLKKTYTPTTALTRKATTAPPMTHGGREAELLSSSGLYKAADTTLDTSLTLCTLWLTLRPKNKDLSSCAAGKRITNVSTWDAFAGEARLPDMTSFARILGAFSKD